MGYDVQGNLANKNGQKYTFDYGNRLRDVTGREYYRYDGLGRRVLAWSSTLGNIVSVYTKAGQLWYQNDQRRRANLNYIYLGGSLVATREVVGSAQTVKYQHADALGTPIAVTGANKALFQTSEYEPYGQLLNLTLTDGPGFTGHVQDALTGLTYMQQRYYDQGIGRFLSTDPVTAYSSPGANFNRYWYANNNPYKFTDPDGRESGAGYATGQYTIGIEWTPETANTALKMAVVVYGGVVGGVNGSLASGARYVFQKAVGDAVRRESRPVTVAGVQVGKTPSEARAALEKAGYEGQPISNPAGTESGILYNVPEMKMEVRVMNGGPKHEPTVVATVQGTKQLVNPVNGKNFGNIPRAQ